MLATSIRNPSERALTAALVAQYTLPPAYAASPATEPTLIMCPRLRCTIPGTTRRVIVNKPLMLVSTIVSQSSRLPSNSGSSPRAKPALFTNTSMFRHSAGNVSMSSDAFSRSLTSKVKVKTSEPFSVSSFLMSARRLSFLPVKITLSPFSANFLAQAKPIPLVAPVINTTLFINMFICLTMQKYEKLRILPNNSHYIRAFCFSPAPEPRYFERASLNFQTRSMRNVRRAGLWTDNSRMP